MFHWNEWTCKRFLTYPIPSPSKYKLISLDYVTPTHFWTLAEGTLSIISASLPTLRPILMGPSHSIPRPEPNYQGFPSELPLKTLGVQGLATDGADFQAKFTKTKRSESVNIPD